MPDGEGGKEYKWHKHNSDGTTCVASQNPEESETSTTIYTRDEDGNTFSGRHVSGKKKKNDDEDDEGITPESEGGGANIISTNEITCEVIDIINFECQNIVLPFNDLANLMPQSSEMMHVNSIYSYDMLHNMQNYFN